MSAYPKRQPLTARQERDAYQLATERDSNICQRCFRDCGPVQRDHRQNRDPFNTVVSNLQCLGLACHIWKTEHPHEALVSGWACPSWARPDQYPATRWLPTGHGTLRPGWVLYADNGTWREITDEEAELRMTGEWPGVSVHDEREAG